jgi:hypothetical protein
MRPDDLLCSRNARSRTPLVERAQWKINQAPSPKKQRASLEGHSISSFDGRRLNRARARAGESLPPTRFLPFGSEQCPIAALFQ